MRGFGFALVGDMTYGRRRRIVVLPEYFAGLLGQWLKDQAASLGARLFLEYFNFFVGGEVTRGESQFKTELLKLTQQCVGARLPSCNVAKRNLIDQTVLS